MIDIANVKFHLRTRRGNVNSLVINYLNVSISGFLTSDGEERELIVLLSISRNFVVYVRKVFLFLMVFRIYFIISSPEPSGSKAELKVYQCAAVRPSFVVVCQPIFIDLLL